MRFFDKHANGTLIALVGPQCAGKGLVGELMVKSGDGQVFVSSALVYLYLDLFKGGSRVRTDISAAFTTIREFFRGWNGWMVWANFPKMFVSRKIHIVYDGVRRSNVLLTAALVARILRRKLVFVILEASDEVRHERSVKRGRPGEGHRTLEQFLAAERADENEVDGDLVSLIKASGHRYCVLQNYSDDREVLRAALAEVEALW